MHSESKSKRSAGGYSKASYISFKFKKGQDPLTLAKVMFYIHGIQMAVISIISLVPSHPYKYEAKDY